MIRKAKNDDLAQLAELFSQLHRYHCEIAPQKHRMPEYGFFEKGIEEILADKEQTVFVNCEEVKDDGRDRNIVNAYAVCKIIDVSAEQKMPRRVCFIDCFSVAEEARRKGIGSMLFDAVKRFGREQGCDEVQLGVDAKNGDAIKFYQKMGLSPRTFILTEQI